MQHTRTGSVREFVREDIPAVVALRRRLFRRSEQASARELEEYLEQLFFNTPGVESELRSLVYLDQHEEVGGFLGVVPREMLFGGRTLRIAVGTQLMVAEHCRGLASRKLARALIQGPQDLTISDAANDAARSIWSSVGGRTSLAYSLTWTLPLKPVRYAAMRATRSLPTRALAYAARPLFAIADMALSRRSTWRPSRIAAAVNEPLDLDRHLPEMCEVLERWTLRPRYSSESLAWVLEHVAAKRELGAPQAVLVRDARGRVLGWFVYCLNRGGVAAVVQIASTRDATDIILGHMMEHARNRGVIALAGRFDPSTVQALSDAGSSLRREGPWMLYHSRHPGVECAIESGDAFVSRLEGEWWMNF